jgi:DNA-binding CsgD family transcriptional regulator
VLERHARSFARDFVPALTPRQRELLEQLALGRSIEEGADRMGVCVHTIDKQMASAKRRMGANTSAYLAALALQSGMIQATVLHRPHAPAESRHWRAATSAPG